MAEYPELRFVDPATAAAGGATRVAVPTGRYRLEFNRPQTVSDLDYLPPFNPRPATGGRALAAVIEFPAGPAPPQIADVRQLARRPEIRRVLPIYTVDGLEFSPLPGRVLISADSQGDADQIAADLTQIVNGLPDGEGNVLESIGELVPEAGLYEFTVGGGPNESGPGEPFFALFSSALALEEGYQVCVDATHPVELATDVECRVYQDYTERYDPPPSQPAGGPEPATVAVLDSFFELDHTSIGFRRESGQAIEQRRGITTLDLDQCSVDAHGTSCAGVIGAFGPDAEAAAAVGELRDAEIIPIRVFEYGLKGFEEVALAKGIRAAVDAGAGVISISLATRVTVSCALQPAVEYAIDNDVVVVAGTGNAIRGVVYEQYREDDPKEIDYPAAFDGVIAVGAAEIRDDRLRRVVDARVDDISWQSKYGAAGADAARVTVVARGIDVRTTSLYNPIEQPLGNYPSGFWGGFQGTSAATPIVAGLAARLRNELGLDAKAVRARIECLARQPAGFAPKVTRRTAGGDERNYSFELGFGWIDRRLESLECVKDTLKEPGSKALTTPERSMMADNTTPADSHDCPSPECEGIPDTGPRVDHCLRPVTEFLRLLSKRECCDLLYAFWKNPYLTARTAGVPYSAAVWMGSGDWDRVNQALMAENNLNTDSVATIVGGLGPIWVKAT